MLPIFLLFVVAHIFAISLGIGPKAAEVPLIASTTYQKTVGDIQGLGLWGTLFIVLHAYSLGGGTYTGIEAVSNGLQALREPRVKTGKKTILYMATSLAFTASGLLLCYLLNQVSHEPGKTLNASLFAKVYGSFFSPDAADIFVIMTLVNRSDHSFGRGPGGIYRWPAGALQYGDRFLGTSSLFSFKRQVSHAIRSLVHGSRRARFSRLHLGQCKVIGCHVQHQRIFDLQSFPTWHVSPLVGRQSDPKVMVTQAFCERSWLAVHGNHSDVHRNH